VVILFPFALLSTLLEGSPFAVVSFHLARSFGRGAGVWLLFYAQTLVIAGLVGAVAWTVWHSLNLRPGDEATLFWLLGPLAIAALFIDMRLLGRLAWWITERIPNNDDESAT
jgi:hypothetical protein